MTEKILYRLTTPEDHDSVLQFLRDHFYKEEPAAIALQQVSHDTYNVQSDMVNIKNDPATCLVAVYGGQIVGAILCGPKGPDEEKRLLEEAYQTVDPKWANMMFLMAFLEREANVYERYKVDKVMHSCLLGVHKEFRQKNVALKLAMKSIERANQLGYQLYTGDCTSSHSVLVAEMCGLECVNVCSLEEFRAPNSDEQVFFPSKEARLVKTFAIRLSGLSKL